MTTARTLVHWLEDVEDPRDGPALEHDLTELLVVAVCAIIAGAQSFTDMAMFAQLRLVWLRRYLVLENGAPSHDTFGRVFRLLDAKRFELAFRGWIGSVVGAAQLEHIAIDGKCVRGSRDGERSPVHLVSAYATRLGVMLCQERVADKSNGIDAIPRC
jgi:hypothetical protein